MKDLKRRQNRGRPLAWFTALAVTAALATPAAAASAAVPADGPAGAPAGPLRQAEDAAVAQAVSSGRPVTVASATQADSTLTARPDGTFRRTVDDRPVRARRDGAWVPLDATLARTADGSYRPAVSTAGLVLSGGGTGPLATLTNGGRSLALDWPTALPAPRVTGDAALYPDVLPGVDLKVTADEQGGFSEVLVVKSAAAAADPGLSRLRLRTSAPGLRLAADAAGNLTATDTATGAALFRAPTPLMWDSSAPAAAAPATATAPAARAGTGDAPAAPESAPAPVAANASATAAASAPPPGAHRAAVRTALSGGALTLTPDSGLLTGHHTRYPVYIDPDIAPLPVSVTQNSSGSTYVQSAYPNTDHYGESADVLGVGDQAFQSPTGIERSYYQFGLGAADGTDISGATLNLTQNYSSEFGCTSYPVTATNVAHIGSTTNWNSQPATYSETGSTPVTGSGNSGCPGDTKAGIDVTAAAQDDGDGVLTFLITDDESNANAFKRFDKKATLDIDYDTPPGVPTSPGSDPTPAPDTNTCTSNGGYGWIGSLAGGNITLSAHVSDPDGTKQHVQGKFSMWDDGGDGSGSTPTDYVYNETDGSYVTGSGSVSLAVPASKLTDGHLYGWEVRAFDGTDTSAASVHCLFWYDTSAPHTPTVSGLTPPSAAGGNLTFALSGTDVVPTGARASGIDHYAYALDSGTALAAGGGTTVGTAGAGSVTVPVTSFGQHHLYVVAVDKAGNQSQQTQNISFYVQQNTATVHPGDVTGDGVPDLLATDSGNNGLDLLQPNGAVPLGGGNPAPPTASGAADAPDGTNWSGTLVAHRSSGSYSATGAKVDDLWAERSGHLWLYSNNLNNAGGLAGNGNEYYSAGHRSQIYRPACAAGDCAHYSTAGWSAATQLVAPGDVAGDTDPDLFTVEGTELWLFVGASSSGSFGSAVQLGAGTDWSGYTLIAPGDVDADGHADLWARNNSTGEIDQFLTTVAPGTGAVSLGGATVLDSTGNFTAAKRPLIASPGDVDGDGYADLLSTVPTAGTVQLWANTGHAFSGNTMFSSHAVVDDSTLWPRIGDLA